MSGVSTINAYDFLIWMLEGRTRSWISYESGYSIQPFTHHWFLTGFRGAYPLIIGTRIVALGPLGRRSDFVTKPLVATDHHIAIPLFGLIQSNMLSGMATMVAMYTSSRLQSRTLLKEAEGRLYATIPSFSIFDIFPAIP